MAKKQYLDFPLDVFGLTLKHVAKVDYSVPSADRTIFLPIAGGIYVSGPCARENGKVKAWLFDLPAILTCKNCALCMDDCYALGRQGFPAVWNKRMVNYWLSLFQPELLESLIIEQIKRHKITVMRIHGSGDFYSQAYLNMWCRIARACPECVFYAYTKMLEKLDFSEFQACKNVNILSSIIKIGAYYVKNYGNAEYLQLLRKCVRGLQLCHYGEPDDQDECMKSCKRCLHVKVMLFHVHGTTTNRKKQARDLELLRKAAASIGVTSTMRRPVALKMAA